MSRICYSLPSMASGHQETSHGIKNKAQSSASTPLVGIQSTAAPRRAGRVSPARVHLAQHTEPPLWHAVDAMIVLLFGENSPFQGCVMSCSCSQSSIPASLANHTLSSASPGALLFPRKGNNCGAATRKCKQSWSAQLIPSKFNFHKKYGINETFP